MDRTEVSYILKKLIGDVFTDSYIEFIADPIVDMSRLPSKSETLTVCVENSKTAALCFDRIWGLDPEIPNGIRFCGCTPAEIALVAGLNIQSILNVGPDEEVIIGDDIIKPGVSPEMAVYATRRFLGKSINGFARNISEQFQSLHGLHVVPQYLSSTKMNEEYQSGNHQVIVSLISDIPLVREDLVEWEQVIEFRKDIDARKKYRRFVHWLDKEMTGKSLDFIKDEINCRLEDYNWALKKHGLKTVLGTLSQLLDSKVVTAVSATVASLALAGKPEVGMLTGGAIIIGKSAVHIGTEMLNLNSVKRETNPEIAFVYELTQMDENNK